MSGIGQHIAIGMGNDDTQKMKYVYINNLLRVFARQHAEYGIRHERDSFFPAISSTTPGAGWVCGELNVCTICM